MTLTLPISNYPMISCAPFSPFMELATLPACGCHGFFILQATVWANKLIWMFTIIYSYIACFCAILLVVWELVATGWRSWERRTGTNSINGCISVSSLLEMQTRWDINWPTCILASPIITAVTLGTVIIYWIVGATNQLIILPYGSSWSPPPNSLSSFLPPL